ncbi:ABC transporter related [Catenulispora acidiphila DSM 44928]|uniref:ABC transporter related n=1 Tax=Catenulispora acidiphila (strain DSM 44928 / JCM 14897 / NBRC 102108 / NRRL B-24433 / ID139908) TaxID=479433 RepID=C7PYB9_CATAD|nr:ABC transporter ATP-binding protein [Catenulispora acidiphila]ACU75409.1 ABC transporter related [Catenulispora acidiphila DSM 44928]
MNWGVDGVTVVLGGSEVLHDVTLNAIPGQVAAVVGGDGAGKTTLLRTLIGRILPSSGAVRAPSIVDSGFMPTGASGVWTDLSVNENIAFVAAARGMAGPELADRRAELLAAAGLSKAADRLAGDLSGGMRQKLAFCLAILHRPRLLVLDEPSTGVDPVSRVDLWRLISRAAAADTAVVMSTAYLDEAERAATCLVLDGGRVLADGTPADVLAAAPGTLTTGSAPAGPAELSWRRGHQTRSWHPGPPRPGEQPRDPDMEDCVIALTLDAQQTGAA